VGAPDGISRSSEPPAIEWLVRHFGRVAWSPGDIALEPESIVQPDLFLIPSEQDAVAREWSDVTRLPLVVEVLSASTARQDRRKKREHYQRTGVDEYWIVDLESRCRSALAA